MYSCGPAELKGLDKNTGNQKLQVGVNTESWRLKRNISVIKKNTKELFVKQYIEWSLVRVQNLPEWTFRTVVVIRKDISFDAKSHYRRLFNISLT